MVSMMDVCGRNLPNLICSYLILMQQIHGITGGTVRPNDISSSGATICNNGGTHISDWTCICPGGLVGRTCNHSLYISFDTIENSTLMQGTEQKNFNALVLGPVNSAVSTNRSQSQWIDLGFHPEVCLTQRYMCGVTGGAVAFWLRLIECPFGSGIITTRTNHPLRHGGFIFATGFDLYCRSLESITYVLILPNGFNALSTGTRNSRPHWFHIVFNFIGPSTGQGFRVYHDGELVLNVNRLIKVRSTSMDRKIVIGRRSTDYDDGSYASLQMDELMMFNRPLTEAEIRMMNP